MEQHGFESASIVWYGERGIINALVVALQAQGTHGWSKLLRAVQWAHGEAHAWLSDLERVVALVEVGFAQFGDPDLILILHGKDWRRVVFVEAKVVPYASSAMSNREGMRQKGFNSSINGQLALRYRLAHALAGSGRDTSLIEPTELHQAYVHALGDAAWYPRRLQKPEVRRILRDHGLLDLKLLDFYFVALTWDAKPFFEHDLEYENTRPRLLRLDGQCAWDEMRSQLGWLGYERIDNAIDLGASYRSALATMKNSKTPTVSSTVDSGPNLATKGLTLFSKPIQDLVSELEVRARDAGFGKVEKKEGSVSVTLGNKVRLKLVPDGLGGVEVMRLGIAAIEEPRTWCEEEPLELRTIKGQPFWFVTLPTERGRAIEVAESIFQQLRARHEPGDESTL
jgi:hypothetical protein